MTQKTPATLYRKDPRVTDDGIKIIVLKPEDAQIDLHDFKFNMFSTLTDLTVIVTELLSHDGRPIQPLDMDDLNYEWIEAQGFLYPVNDIRIKDKSKKIIELLITYDPAQLVTNHRSLTARYMGDYIFKLDRSFDFDMPRPACLRGKSKHSDVIPLERDKKNKDIFHIRDKHHHNKFTEKDKDEVVQILSNWDPSSFKWGLSKWGEGKWGG